MPVTAGPDCAPDHKCLIVHYGGEDPAFSGYAGPALGIAATLQYNFLFGCAAPKVGAV